MSDPDVHVTVNPEWWQEYAAVATPDKLDRDYCWCSDAPTCAKYGLKHFSWYDDRSKSGLSDDPRNVHLGHSSGFAALNIAYLMGCSPIGLLGHDMRYPKGYDGKAKVPGGLRHYFGEYPKWMQHWPSVRVRSTGELDGLIECYEGVAAQDPPVSIINLTPNSAVTCFPFMPVEDFCHGIAAASR
jgi:hypothetical protein